MSSYSPSINALKATISDEFVTIVNDNELISFYPSTKNEHNKGIIFFHGANVEAESYAILGRLLAENGVSFVAFKMTSVFSNFDPSYAIELIKKLDHNTDWFVAGHSLGGAIASRMMYLYKESFEGLILLASYPAGKGVNLSRYHDLRVLSVWATKDYIVSKERIFTNKSKLPDKTIYYEIRGGNHAQFGSYGIQSGDHKADISETQQITETVAVITKFIFEDRL